MNIKQLKETLQQCEALNFYTPEGKLTPQHFHVTELGLISRHFIDCGTSIHTDNFINFQIWVAEDTAHRLSPDKFQGIISASEKVIGSENHEIEVEYQSNTIGRYGLEFKDGAFHLTNKYTDCLAKDNCGVPKKKLNLVELGNEGSCCTPGGGCC
ncbi:MAG TPA: DUF6428 family protein [Bacteroidia bacterium]